MEGRAGRIQEVDPESEGFPRRSDDLKPPRLHLHADRDVLADLIDAHVRRPRGFLPLQQVHDVEDFSLQIIERSVIHDAVVVSFLQSVTQLTQLFPHVP